MKSYTYLAVAFGGAPRSAPLIQRVAHDFILWMLIDHGALQVCMTHGVDNGLQASGFRQYKTSASRQAQ